MDERARPADSGSASPSPSEAPGPPQSGAYAPKLPHIPGLDGLRALAVAAVLLYHADLAWIPGGFIGVEVFFVISGYLITSLLLAEWRERGSITLHAFWLRRARRLLPAVYTLILTVLVTSVIAFPGEVASLRGDAIASFIYVENWYLIFENQSYFEAMGRLSMLRHLWSLAVEEQFYIIWPLVLAVLLNVVRQRIAMAAVLAATAASAALMAAIYVPEIDPSRVYFGTDTRATGLLIGSVLAFVWVPRRLPDWSARLPRWLPDAAGVAALAALVAFSLGINEFVPFLYRGGFILIAIATAMIIAVTVHPASRLADRVLGWGPLTWVGVRSYSIYLWHWPVVCVTRPRLDVALDGLPLLALRLAATLVLAECSYRFVETPIRRGAIGRAWHMWTQSSGRDHMLLSGRWATLAVAVFAGVTVLGVRVATAQHTGSPDYQAAEPVQAEALLVSRVSAPEDVRFGQPNDGGRAADVPGAARPAEQPTADSVPTPTASPEPTDTVVAEVTAAAESTTSIPTVPETTVTATPAASGTPAWTPTPAVTAAPAAATKPPASAASPTGAPASPPPAASWAPSASPTTVPSPTGAASPAANHTQSPSPAAPSTTPAGGVTESIAPGSAPGTGGAPSYVTPQPPAPTSAPAAAPLAVGPVTAIGDSVMLGAYNELRRQIANVDVEAAVSRQVSEAIAILGWRGSSGQLGGIVVIHMGNNGVFTAGQFDEIMRLVGSQRRVIFLNVAVPRRWTAPNNAVIYEGARKYPNSTVLDWASIVDTRPDMLWGDGIHLRPEGAYAYTRLIVSALR